MSKNTSRQSVALGTGQEAFSEQQLQANSYDLLLFPSYLRRKIAPRVRVEIVAGPQGDPDLMGCYEERGEQRHSFAFLRADEGGVETDSDALYEAVHAAFAAYRPQAQYLGFARYGRPPVAPLFALALMYRRYGRGLYRAGAFLPVPWSALTAGYAVRC